VAVKRGKSQARRNQGNRVGMPGWAWLVLGVVITLGAVLFLPRYLKGGDGDGFFRPHPNPDAQPLAESADEDQGVVADGAQAPAKDASGKPGDKDGDFDFYTLLPGTEVALSDAQIAAAEKAEQVRAQQAAQQTVRSGDDAADAALPTPLPETPSTPAATQVASAMPGPAASGGNDTPYLLQAGAFGASGDAEAVKAKIALLGLNARVESAQIGGKTVYRVRMGPYGSASELATAKGKLADGGLPAMAIKVK
jgi:cell division protein FtsN